MKYKYLLFIAFFLPLITHGAIARDYARGRISTVATSFTYSHVTTGSNLALFTGMTIDSSDVVTGCTHNGDTMTLVNKIAYPASWGGRWNYLFYRIAPDVGTYNIVCSASASTLWLSFSASYTGVNQSLTYTGGSPTDDENTTTADGTNAMTGNVTTVADNSWGIMTGGEGCCTAENGTNFVVWAPNDATGAQFQGDTNGAISPAGSLSMTTNWTGAPNGGAAIIASFSPVPAAAPPPPVKVPDLPTYWNI